MGDVIDISGDGNVTHGSMSVVHAKDNTFFVEWSDNLNLGSQELSSALFDENGDKVEAQIIASVQESTTSIATQNFSVPVIHYAISSRNEALDLNAGEESIPYPQYVGMDTIEISFQEEPSCSYSY